MKCIPQLSLERGTYDKIFLIVSGIGGIQEERIMKCGNCGSTMVYDVARQGLVCDHCGSYKPLPKSQDDQETGQVDYDSVPHRTGSDWGSAKSLVTCKSCGAKLIIDAEHMSGMCPFCGSSVVLTLEDSDCGILPSAIIPFTITREQVEEKFYRWNKFAFWSPEKFRKGKVLGNLTPVYVPYWTFDADTKTSYEGEFGYTTGSGDSEKTNWYGRSGVVEKHIEGVCICGSRRFHDDKLLNSVISFKIGDLIAYTPEALSGMTAEKSTISMDAAMEEAKATGFKKEIINAARKDQGADDCAKISMETQYSNVKFRYVLVPVWLAGCRYGGKIYNIVASGHNWQGNCRRPVSVPKIVGFTVAFLALIFVTVFLGVVAFVLPLAFMALIAAFIIYLIMFMRTFRDQNRIEREMQDRAVE